MDQRRQEPVAASGDLRMATTLLMLIGEETASDVLRHLSESEIEALTKQISASAPVAPQDAEKSAEDLYRLLMTQPAVSDGGPDYARKVIMRALEPGSAQRIIDRLSSVKLTSNAFQTIDRMNPQQLTQFLQNEHPQTVAL